MNAPVTTTIGKGSLHTPYSSQSIALVHLQSTVNIVVSLWIMSRAFQSAPHEFILKFILLSFIMHIKIWQLFCFHFCWLICDNIRNTCFHKITIHRINHKYTTSYEQNERGKNSRAHQWPWQELNLFVLMPVLLKISYGWINIYCTLACGNKTIMSCTLTPIAFVS